LNTFISILEFVLALGSIILLHELGHFIVGRLNKIEVEEFGIGFPPRALKLFTWKGTLFTLNWIPLGGFCRFKGEEDPNAPGGLSSANKWARLTTLLGGSLMNLLLASLLFAMVISQYGMPQTNIAKIQEVIPGSPAEIAGLKNNDILISVNGEKIISVDQIISVTQANLGKEMTFVVKRFNQEILIQVTPRLNPPSGEGPLGVILSNPIQPVNFFQAIPGGVQTTFGMVRQLIILPVMFLRGQVDSSQMRLVSPKGIYDIYSQVRTESEQATNNNGKAVLLNLVSFFGIISAALGFSNLLPIPAVDGGRIFFMIPELLFNKRVPAKFENAVHAIGFTILLAIMVLVLIQDFINPIVLPK
jgi:regulator of sigma E protease